MGLNSHGAPAYTPPEDYFIMSHVIDGNGAPPSTGVKVYLEVPHSGHLTRVTLLADQVGDALIDLWRDTYNNFPPDMTDTQIGVTSPEIVAGVSYQDEVLTGWALDWMVGDIIAINLTSVTDIEILTVSLWFTKT